MAKNGKSGKSKEPLVVQSKVREVIKKNNMNCSSDVMMALTELVTEHLGRGCARAKSNGRKTLRAADL